MIEQLMHEAGLTQEQVGKALGITQGAVNHKLAHRRPWMQREVDVVLALLSDRLGRAVKYEECFQVPEPATTGGAA